MKKTTKSLLTTALILVIAGLVLSLGSFLYAKIAGKDIYGIERAPRLVESTSYSLSEILKDSPDADYTKKLTTTPFTKIDVLSFVGKVEIRSSDRETYVSLDDANTNNIRVEVIGTTLTVAEENDVGFFGVYIGEKGFSFKGLRQIFGPGNSSNSGKTMTVYLEKDLYPEEINIRSSVGDVYIEGANAELLTVHSFAGTVELKKNFADKIQVEKTFGDLILDQNTATSVSAGLRAGSIRATLAPGVQQSNVLDLWVGSLSIDTNDNLSLFKINLSATVGEVLKNGVKCGKSLQQNSDTKSRISATALLGSLSVNDHGAAVPPPKETENETENETETQTAEETVTTQSGTVPDEMESALENSAG